MYCIKAVNKGKVGYRCRVNDVVADTVYSLFLFLIYTQIVFIFSVELVIGDKLGRV